MKNRFARIVFLFLALAPFGAAFAGEFYLINGFVEGTSGDGSLISGSANGEYYLWDEVNGMVPIGGSAAGGGVGGQPRLSADGSRLAGTYLNPVSGVNEMSYYDVATNTWHPLGGIGGQSGTETSSGWDISRDGRSVVGLGWLPSPQTGAHAIQWTEGGTVVDLGSTVAGRSSRANAANLDGSVVAGWQDASSGFRQGAVWTNGAQTLITDSTSGAMLGEAVGLSDDGQFAVGLGVSANAWQGWRWSQGTGGVALGNIFNPTWRGGASGISGDGNTVVGFYRPFGQFPTSGSGFLWTPGGGMVDLTAVATNLGIDLQATTLSLPLAISQDGKTIVGLGRQGVALSVGFVLQLESDGDFDNDGDYACADVDALVAEIVAGTNNALYDMTGDGLVNHDDLTKWLAEAGAAEIPSGNPYLEGDANLDSVVDGTDFIEWNMNKFTNVAAWCSGDFNADGAVDGSDFILWNMNKFTSADNQVSAVPEPAWAIWELALATACLLSTHMRRFF